jgi:Helix-turn-helix domain of resolvase
MHAQGSATVRVSALAMLGKGTTNTQIAKAARVQRQTVYRIKADRVAAEAALAAWGL